MNETAPIQLPDDDLDLLAESGRRVGKLTVFLIAAVLAGVAFIGGVAVQKHFSPSASFTMPSGFSGRPGGMGSNAEQRTPVGASASVQAPAVVGTVAKISGRTLTVKNFAGESVLVKVPAGTSISDSSDTALEGLEKGVSVSVVGEKADDGTVTATSITAS